MGVLTALWNGLSALAKALGLVQQRDAEMNTPSERANAEASRIQADRDQAAKDVASPDPAQLEKDVAE